MSTTDTRWMRHAACAYHPDPDAWFHIYNPSTRRDMAISICNQCPVQPQCLAHAMRQEGSAPAGDRSGIWGGKTPVERAAMRSQRHCITCRTNPVNDRHKKCDQCITEPRWLARRNAT